MKNLKEIIEQHKDEEGNVQWDKAEGVVNEEINRVVARESDIEKVKPKVVKNIMEELNLEGETVDDIKKALEASEPDEETQQQLEKYKADLEKVQNERDELAKTKEELEGQTSKLTREQKLIERGVTDPDDRDYLLYNAEKRIDEENDFDSVIEQLQEEKPKFFQEQQQPQPQTSGASVRQSNKNAEQSGVAAILAEKYPDEFKNNES